MCELPHKCVATCATEGFDDQLLPLLRATLSVNLEKLLDNAHDLRKLLRILGFALVADLVLASLAGMNLWAIRWPIVGDRPALLIVVLLVYGVTIRVIGPVVCHLAIDLAVLIVVPIQIRLGLANGARNSESLRYVSWMQAEKWLREQHDPSRRNTVEKQMAEQREAKKEWFSMIDAAWVGITLVVVSFFVPGSSVAALRQISVWAPFIVLALPALPCLYQLWRGSPDFDQIELPELAERLAEEKRKVGQRRVLAGSLHSSAE